MKKKIEDIFNICNVNAYEYKDDGYAHEVSMSDLADKVINSLSRPRFPEKDGWPLDPNESALCMHKSGELKINYTIDYERCGEPKPNDPVLWYITIDEIINLVEGER